MAQLVACLTRYRWMPVSREFVLVLLVVQLFQIQVMIGYIHVLLLALFQVIVNLIYQRPRYDLSAEYFIKVYRAECVILRQHVNLVKNILDKQVCIRFGFNITVQSLLQFEHQLFFNDYITHYANHFCLHSCSGSFDVP